MQLNKDVFELVDFGKSLVPVFVEGVGEYITKNDNNEDEETLTEDMDKPIEDKASEEKVYQKGYQEGLASIQKQCDLMQDITKSYENEKNKIDEQIEGLILDLIVQFTEQLLGAELTSDPNKIKDILNDVITEVITKKSKCILKLQEDDYNCLKKLIEEKKLDLGQTELLIESSLMRGEFQLISDGLKTDHTIQSRIGALMAHFKQSNTA